MTDPKRKGERARWRGKASLDPSRPSRPSGKAYEGAFESVAAILIAGGLGYWADAHFEASPRYLLVGLAIGFGAFVLRLWRLGLALQAAAEEEQKGRREGRGTAD